jgi:hypothetical protein
MISAEPSHARLSIEHLEHGVVPIAMDEMSIEHEAEHDRTFTKGLVASSFQMQYSGFASEI